ncbi:MAG: 4-hydroxy-tetrahydrodipicolinate synthase [Deltaproteobacteria bacterium]|nr:4-hydroxy-tetrahydrodipicolinate synthase [Deltaproteobacteria bacterium]
MISGAMVAIVTPFTNGQLDEDALRALIEFQIENGTHAIVPCGTTGESATLSHAEHKRVVEITIEQVKGRIPVIAGTGSNNTAEALELTRHAKAVKADAALMITPYYNKPSQEGLYHHFKKVAGEVPIPIVLYNVPGRTGVNMLPETVARLAEIDNIQGIKEASGDMAQIAEVIRVCAGNLNVVSGDDFLTLPVLAAGGTGIISVVSNVAPKMVSSLVDAFNRGELATAREIYLKSLPLCRAMFLETNPVPAKTALALMGKIGPEIRLPLWSMTSANQEKLKGCLREYQLL